MACAPFYIVQINFPKKKEPEKPALSGSKHIVIFSITEVRTEHPE